MEGLVGFGVSLAFVIAWSWYRGRGKRAANKEEKEFAARLKEMGVKFED